MDTPKCHEGADGEIEIEMVCEWSEGPRRRLVTPMDLWRRWKANRNREEE